MKRPHLKARPPIVYGAVLLAVCSLAWSAYSITDLMASGPYGLTVAIAGDIGWITVLWAEAHGVAIAGRTWPAVLAGWLIAIGVGVLLAVHGTAADEHALAKAIAGPFVVAVGKLVWLFALAALRDPAGPTAEQQLELNTVMRDSAHEAAMLHARANAEIARIRAQASVTLARDETDFEIGLERIDKRAELHRRTPLALDPSPAPASFDRSAEQAIEVIAEQGEQPPNAPSMLANNQSEQLANNPLNRANVVPEQPSIADLVREQIAITEDNATAVRNVLAVRPDANKESVAASVRRERKKAGPYL
ncbi:hypothetical protein AB0J81_09230 [Streptomyces bobili]|uniref:hypothetical protein n=1 Tax=Streptomyces bobili TaxID=67280 RepID=UPI00342B0CFF